ncbi:MAG TPA: HDOD domain-containing protein [Dongiaceae bacterium]|nr:HDOD domain-containing protein [Dongiaceae bacterium]
MNQASVVRIHLGTLRRLTLGLTYFRDWSVPQLKSIEPGCRTVLAPVPTLLLQLNGLEPFAYFLIRGEVQLQNAQDETRVLRAGELDAGFPIAQQRPCPVRVIALPGAELLRVESSKLRSQQVGRAPVRFFAAEEAQDAPWRDHPLVLRLIRQAQDGTLALPSMPAVALRVRQAMGREEVRMDDLVNIINTDPAMVTRLLKVANSALLGAQTPCETVKSALLRLGLDKSHSIVTSLLARDLFSARTASVKNFMARRWQHAIDMAALCAVLARLTPGLQPERALLVGLLHEIGALPLIRMAEAYPDLTHDSDLLRDILTHLTPELSMRALEEWGFHTDFISAAQHQHHWFRDHDGAADYTDVLLIAHLHALVHARAQLHLPRIDEVPAFSRLALGQLTPDLSLQVLDEARQQIQEWKALLI